MRQTSIFNSTKNIKKWYIIDAKNLILGRLASKISIILRGKQKKIYTPHIDCGDNLIIINAHKIIVTGKKLKNKIYYHHSGYPGGLKKNNFQNIMQKNPIYCIKHAVKGMLPKNKLSKKIFKHLFVYGKNTHLHHAQKPIKLLLK